MSRVTEQFAASLKQGREAAGLTHRDLADRIGTSPSCIPRLEGGVCTTTLENADALLRAVGLRLVICPLDNDPDGKAASDSSNDCEGGVA